jgi:glycosyltransferase involved in cell wall biosynthesis
VEPIYKNTLWPGFQKKVEKFLLQKADTVTTVSDGISAKMKEIHPDVHTITKGVTLRPVQSSFDHFTIHYSGSLFLDYRDPRPLFRVMHKLLSSQKMDLNKVRFIYAGKDGQRMSLWAAEKGLEPIFVNKGMLPRYEALDYQSKSHINLLLTSASEEHTGLLTGKLFEYIEAGREILCWIKGSKDQEIEKMFDDYGLGSVLFKEDDLEAYVIQKYREWIETGEVRTHHKQEKIMKELSWEHQAGKVLQLIENFRKS